MPFLHRIRNRQVTCSTQVVGSISSSDLLSLLTAPPLHCDVDCDVDSDDRWPLESVRARSAGTASSRGISISRSMSWQWRWDEIAAHTDPARAGTPVPAHSTAGPFRRTALQYRFISNGRWKQRWQSSWL